MSNQQIPESFQGLGQRHRTLLDAVESLGQAAKQSGPIDEKTAQLIQLAAAAGIRSEGAVHSHVRRALQAGSSTEEIEHAIVLLTSTIGFPSVAAALSWVGDIVSPDP
jgi:alkylhydroperoxidase/carboxymuconolactone decarboxylase family protein YurZ